MARRSDVHDYVAMARAIRAFGRDAGFSEEEITANLPNLNARLVHLKKNQVVAHQGTRATILGLVIAGTLQMVIRAANGASCLMRAIRPGEYAGHSLLFEENPIVPCDTIAYPDCTVIVFDRDAILRWRRDLSSRPFFRMLEDQLSRSLIVAWQRSVIVSPYKLADRVMAYLAIRSAEDGLREITLPGTLDDFAAFLACDRMALSRALASLCRQGRIARHGRGRIELLNAPGSNLPMKEVVTDPGCTSPVPALRRRLHPHTHSQY